MALQIPVIFVVFNRPDLTQRVFEAIRMAQPSQLFVVADGPRLDRLGELELCAAARMVTEHVDWPCEVTREYSDVNLGCGRRISSGITRAFVQYEEAIILEDDCLPHPDFFTFCTEILNRYRHDERIMCVSGDNFQNGKWRGEASYYFSKYPHCWGWATWRRAWRHFDFEMKAWSELKKSDALSGFCPDATEREYWHRIFDRIARGSRTWSYQWTLACWAQSGLTTLPNANLVSNIGFRADGTHTTSSHDDSASLPCSDLGEIRHPQHVFVNREADLFSFENHFRGNVQKGGAPSHSRFLPVRVVQHLQTEGLVGLAKRCLRKLRRMGGQRQMAN